MAEQIGMPRNTKGLVVENVEPAGAAANAGIQNGDDPPRRPEVGESAFIWALRPGSESAPLAFVMGRVYWRGRQEMAPYQLRFRPFER